MAAEKIKRDFFISRAGGHEWAKWIFRVLWEAGFTTLVQAEDFARGEKLRSLHESWREAGEDHRAVVARVYEKAKNLIAATGYHRRDRELTDLEALL